MPRYNKATNPSCSVNTTGWRATTWTRFTGDTVGTTSNTTGASLAIPTSAWANSGAAGGVSTNLAGSGNMAWSFVGWVKSTINTTINVSISRYNGTSWISPTFADVTNIALTANTWTQVRGTGTSPSSGTYDSFNFHVDFPTSNSAGATLKVGSIRLEQISDAALTYADGNTAGWTWDGTSGASSSSEMASASGPEPGRFFIAG